MSAMPMPAITSRIDGAIFSRCAATATAASTASMNSSVCTVAVIASELTASSDQVGHDVHGQANTATLKKNDSTP